MARRRSALPVTVLMVLLAPLYRAFAWNLELNPVAFFVLTPSSCDALGIGGVEFPAHRGGRADP